MPRKPTDEELHLWHEAMRGTKKFKNTAEIKLPPAPAKPVKKSKPVPVSAAPKVKVAPLERGVFDGVDANTASKLKRGKFAISRTLDLHGHHRESAHEALRAAVKQAYHAGARCLLVITGQGEVLRGSLPGWLNDADLRPFVLAFDRAIQAHGGAGAFYVLIRRKRD